MRADKTQAYRECIVAARKEITSASTRGESLRVRKRLIRIRAVALYKARTSSNASLS
jgi:hypothetical protein